MYTRGASLQTPLLEGWPSAEIDVVYCMAIGSPRYVYFMSTSAGNVCRWTAGAVVFCLALATVAAQEPPVENVVRGIRAAKPLAGRPPAAAKDEIEIELHSSREFPILNQVVVLRVGTRDFFKSRTPEDGSLHTLIFSVPADVFDDLPDGAGLTVRFGKGEPDTGQDVARGQAGSRLRWDFGPLDKSLLRR